MTGDTDDQRMETNDPLSLYLSPTVIIAKVVRKFYTNNQVFYKIVIKKEYKVGGELSPGEGIVINSPPLSLSLL